jgi:hypothetical protein
MRERTKNNAPTRIAHIDLVPFDTSARVDDITECMGDILAHDGVIQIKTESGKYVIQTRASVSEKEIFDYVNKLKHRYGV